MTPSIPTHLRPAYQACPICIEPLSRTEFRHWGIYRLCVDCWFHMPVHHRQRLIERTIRLYSSAQWVHIGRFRVFFTRNPPPEHKPTNSTQGWVKGGVGGL